MCGRKGGPGALLASSGGVGGDMRGWSASVRAWMEGKEGPSVMLECAL